MHHINAKTIDFATLVRDGQQDEAKQLFFDDAAWVITSPMVNVAQKLYDDARRNRRESLFGGSTVEPTEGNDGELVPLTITREQAVLRRVHRAVSNTRHFGNTNILGSKPF